MRITPDVSVNWVDDDSLPEGRSMGNMIALPDGTFWIGNGANTGVAGYGVNVSWGKTTVIKASFAVVLTDTVFSNWN